MKQTKRLIYRYQKITETLIFFAKYRFCKGNMKVICEDYTESFELNKLNRNQISKY